MAFRLVLYISSARKIQQNTGFPEVSTIFSQFSIIFPVINALDYDEEVDSCFIIHNGGNEICVFQAKNTF